MKHVNQIKIAVWHANEHEREKIVTVLHDLGGQHVLEGAAPDELIELVRSDKDVGLIICGARLGRETQLGVFDGDSGATKSASHLSPPCGLVSGSSRIVERSHYGFLGRAHSLDRVINNGSFGALSLCAIRRIRSGSARSESGVRASKTDRTGKGCNHATAGHDEESAYQHLRRRAMDDRVKMVVAAERVLTTDVV